MQDLATGPLASTFEVTAGEIVEEDVIGGLEKAGTAFLEMVAEGRFMLKQSILTSVKRILGGDAEVVVQ